MTQNQILSIAFLLITLCLQAQELSVMTYNIRYYNPDNEENRWDHQKDFLAEQIAFYTIKT